MKRIEVGRMNESIIATWSERTLVTPEELYRALARNAEVKKLLKETGTSGFRMPASKKRTSISDIPLMEYHIGTLEFDTVIVSMVDSTVEVFYETSIQFNTEELGAFCNYYKDRVK